MEEFAIFNLKNFKSKILPTVTVCGSALFLFHAKASANQINTINQNRTVQTSTVNTGSNNNSNNNNNPDDNETNSNQSVNTTQNQGANEDDQIQAVKSVSANTSNTSNESSQEGSSQQVSYNADDKGNYAYLDSVKLTEDGHVDVSGWNATNSSENKPYHYIIAYDNTTHREISRVLVNQPVDRPDVQKVHNVYGARQSGFNVSIQIPSDVLANANSISFISRYSDRLGGNGNYSDFWYAPITFDKENHAWLDKVVVSGDQLQVSGWNANNAAANKPYHTILIYDRTTNQVVASKTVQNLSRPDVEKAYPEVINAGKSGFSVSFDLGGLNLSHRLQIVSRYSTSANGNGQNVDYYFTPITTGNYTNQAYLDQFNLSDGQHLTVSGWHADDISKLENNHFLILFDKTANKQVAVLKTQLESRPDVAKVYQSIDTAGKSGFSGSFDLSQINLQPGHTYSIVSRYSTSSTGNGGAGQYTDYWFNPVNLNQKAYYFDDLKMENDGLHLSGWMISDYAMGRDNAFAIVLENGKEIARQKLNLVHHGGVANQYSNVYNSDQSGFDTVFKLNPANVTGDLQVILRFSGSADGNSDYDDQYSNTYSSNAGYFDSINVSDDAIYVSGWHTANAAVNKPYQYLIFVDANTGKEIYRQRVLDINRSRTDVAKSYPTILNSDKSGYQLWFKLPSQLDHHTVKVIHRITDDVNGNGNYVDVWSDPVSIHNNRWAWPFPQDGQGHFMGSQLFGVNPGGEFRLNGFHDGLDFGSIDHPGTQVHAIHSGTIVRVAYGSGLDWYVLEDTGEYLIVYQEAFSSRSQITVHPGQKIEVGDVIGNRNTSHVHIGITRQHNFSVALSKSFINDGTWLNPLEIIRNGLNG